MSKTDNSISQKMAKLDDLVSWFDSNEFDIDKSLERFTEAKELADEIERDLTEMKNTVNIMSEQFDKG